MVEVVSQQMPEEGQRAQNTNMRIAGTPDERVTTRVDVHDYVDEKRKAFAAHISQNDPDSWFATMADQIYELAFGTEYYQLVRGKPGSELPEDDLFVGIAYRSRKLERGRKSSSPHRPATAPARWTRFD